MSTRRVRNEIQLWRMHWQQIDTLYDRVQGAKDEDQPHAIRCKALHDAAVVLERLRLRRGGQWMPSPLPMGPGVGVVTSIESEIDSRQYELPGPLDMEMAIVGLKVNDEDDQTNPPKAQTNPPKVELQGSETLFDVWDPQAMAFVSQYAPQYLFGRLDLGQGGGVPFVPNLFELKTVEPQIGADDSSEDALFCVPRRKTAATEGIVQLKSWSALRGQRKLKIESDNQAEALAAGQPEFTTIADLIASNRYAEARNLLRQAASWAEQDAATLQTGIDLLQEEDPEDDAIAPLDTLRETVEQERSLLASARNLLAGQVSFTERSRALGLLNMLPGANADETYGADLYPLLDMAVESRIAYPDGTLRAVRTLERGLVATWRNKAPWFDQRLRLFLSPLMTRFFRVFETNLQSLVENGSTQPAPVLIGLKLETATVANSDKLPLEPPASGQHDLGRVRAGQIAVLGGARPALAVILGHKTAAANRQQLRILPLRVSLAQGLGLDGIPGLVEAGAGLGNGLSRPVTGEELRRGRRDGEPEGDAIPQQAVALWSRLKLIRGERFTLTLPAPFAATLNLPVHTTEDAPLEAHAPRLLLPTAPYDEGTDPPTPLVGTPGEILLLRGRDADGLWHQGAVEAVSATVTTMEALEVTPEQDPDSPICCTPETPVVLLTLSMNSIPVALVDQVTLHRGFLGFGWPDLAVGTVLPARIDADTDMLAAYPLGNGFRFSTGTGGTPVDRTPELDAAVQILDRWLGEP